MSLHIKRISDCECEVGENMTSDRRHRLRRRKELKALHEGTEILLVYSLLLPSPGED
jgi:hypothetical protein